MAALPPSQGSAEAKQYLSSLLNKSLHVHTNDDRVFVGDFKCTDNECNIILSKAFEYRHPEDELAASFARGSGTGRAKVTMQSRFMGLIVIPGKYITKIELP